MNLRLEALINELAAEARQRHPGKPALVGVAGAQGSGKSYHCRAFTAEHAPNVAHFSLDDVYLTRAERMALAKSVHPLFSTRGPPGTHDLALATRVLDALDAGEPVLLPRFDKSRNDRSPEGDWPGFAGRADVVLFDGWCVGALPIEDSAPINALEAEADAESVWRRAVQANLESYQSFFDRFDAFIYLQAPNFEIVERWRGEQEEAMLGRAMTGIESAALRRFIQHYERITRHMLAGGHRAGWIVRLDEARNVLGIEQR